MMALQAVGHYCLPRPRSTWPAKQGKRTDWASITMVFLAFVVDLLAFGRLGSITPPKDYSHRQEDTASTRDHVAAHHPDLIDMVDRGELSTPCQKINPFAGGS